MHKTLQIPRALILLTVMTTFVYSSCVTHKALFSKDIFLDFQLLKIDKAISFEKRNKSKDITRDYFIDIGKSIYPNKNNYKLAIAKTFRRKKRGPFKLEIDYYYVSEDSSVKLILYEWNKLDNKKNVFEDDKTRSVLFANFQARFNQLSDSLTKYLGVSIEKNIEQNKLTGETFRDEIKWKSRNELNAYLFMLGNNGNGYREIRLAIYKD